MGSTHAAEWRRKRVLYVEANEDGTVGGSHKILVDLVTRLSDDFQPVVLFYQDNAWAQHLRDAGVEVHTWDVQRRAEKARFGTGGKLSTLKTLLRVVAGRRQFLRDHRIDIVHLNNSPFSGCDDWLPAARASDVPCVVYAMGGPGFEPKRYRRMLMRRFDRVFPLSHCVAEGLALNGISKQKTVVTYPGLPVTELQGREYRSAQEVRAEFDVPEHCLLATMVGNIRHWKGQHVVLEALAQLEPSIRSRLRVLFVGETGAEHVEYRSRLDSMTTESDLQEVVRFTGHRDDVSDLLEASDLAIHASVIPEPFGLVVLEAMLHGCTVLAADQGGPVEMLTTGTGIVFDASDPTTLSAGLTEVAMDAELRARLSSGAKVRARDFEIAKHVELIEDVYREL